ncbi:dihydrodipicolinate synthase family protein [Petrimonas sp.]|uniref:dihydrodipicolinate synthase family protein n=1 Tax=Petrimonas sp. TaxID=2023866 RepID=UPI002FCC8E1A
MILQGITPAIAATFKENGEYDYESYTHLIRVMIKGGVHGVTLFAIAGEYYKLTEEEEKKLVEITVEECRKGRVQSIISITKHASEVAAKWARYVQDAGADCLMLLPPFFLKPSAASIIEHVKMVNDAVSIPIMFQYAPDQTGVAIAPEVLVKMSRELENVKILKIENKPPGKYVSRLKEEDSDVEIFVGNAGFQMIENFDRGAGGVLPGCSMFDIYLKIYRLYREGKRQEAMMVHNDLVAMLNHIRQNVEMIICFEKKILKRRGFIASDYCRKPDFDPDRYHMQLFDEYYRLIEKHFDPKLANLEIN